MARAVSSSPDGFALKDVEAPLAFCTRKGEVHAATPTALALFRRLSILDDVPALLPEDLWRALDAVPPGRAVEWRPPAGPREVLGCTRYRATTGYLLAMKEVSEMHAEQSRQFHRQRLEAIGRLVASIAHELRNSVASIVYSLDLLAMCQDDVPPETLSETLPEIMNASLRLQATVDGLLEYARLGPAVAVRVSLEEVLTRGRGFLRSLYRESSHQVRVELGRGAGHVQGNSLTIEQIFVNLLLNAAEAATTAVRVRITSDLAGLPGAPLRDPPMVRVRVSDDGPGIPDHLRESVFQPFFTTREDGIGLGLNSAAAAAASMGGRLVLENTELGASFAVYLPYSPAPGDGVEPTQRRKP